MDKKELPKLPKGMGNYDYVRNKIRYRKQITLNNVTKNLSVTGNSIAEVNKLMQKKEAEFKRNVKLGEIKKESITLSLAMREWMDLYKSEELNRKRVNSNSFVMGIVDDYLNAKKYILDIPFNENLLIYSSRENEINNFVKKPFYNVILNSDNGLALKSERIDEKEQENFNQRPFFRLFSSVSPIIGNLWKTLKRIK